MVGTRISRDETYLDPRAKRSRAALRKALGELLGEMSLEDITCLGVAQRAGIGYATFYRNYEGLEALVADLAGELVDELAELMSASTQDQRPIDKAFEITNFVNERRELLRPLLVGAGARIERDVMDRALAAAAQSTTVTHSTDLPATLAISHQVTSIIIVLRWWMEDGVGYSAQQVAEFVRKLAFDSNILGR